MLQMLMTHISATALSFSTSPMTLRGVSWISYLSREILGPGLQIVLHNILALPESIQLYHYRSNLRHLVRQLCGQNFEQCTWLFVLPRKGDCQKLGLKLPQQQQLITLLNAHQRETSVEEDLNKQ